MSCRTTRRRRRGRRPSETKSRPTWLIWPLVQSGDRCVAHAKPRVISGRPCVVVLCHARSLAAPAAPVAPAAPASPVTLAALVALGVLAAPAASAEAVAPAAETATAAAAARREASRAARSSRSWRSLGGIVMRGEEARSRARCTFASSPPAPGTSGFSASPAPAIHIARSRYLSTTQRGTGPRGCGVVRVQKWCRV